MADEIAGCRVLDVSTPKSSLVNTISTQSHVFNVVVKVTGFISAGDDGFYIADITDPANPVQLGGYRSRLNVTEFNHTFWGWIVDFKVEGNLVYLEWILPGFSHSMAVWSYQYRESFRNYAGGYEAVPGICNSVEKFGNTVFIVGLGQYISVDVTDPTKVYYKGNRYSRRRGPDCCRHRLIPTGIYRPTIGVQVLDF